jgi:hypothetical protein
MSSFGKQGHSAGAVAFRLSEFDFCEDFYPAHTGPSIPKKLYIA